MGHSLVCPLPTLLYTHLPWVLCSIPPRLEKGFRGEERETQTSRPIVLPHDLPGLNRPLHLDLQNRRSSVKDPN